MHRHPLSHSTPSLAPTNTNTGATQPAPAYGMSASQQQQFSYGSHSAVHGMPPALPVDITSVLSGLFSQISRLSDEKKQLQSAYQSARQRRKEVQAELQLGTAQTAQEAEERRRSSSPPSESKPRSATTTTASGSTPLTVNTELGLQGRSRGRAQTTGVSSTGIAAPALSSSALLPSCTSASTCSIEVHSARLRSASLERARAREQRTAGPSFPRTMLSGAGDPVSSGIQAPIPQSSRPASQSPLTATASTPPLPEASTSPIDPSLFQATQELCLQLRDPSSGLSVRDLTHRSQVYPSSFRAREAVEWMVERKWAWDREDAVTLLQALVDQGVIVSCLEKHTAASSGEQHHRFEDTTDQGAIYRLLDPMTALSPAGASATNSTSAATAASAGGFGTLSSSGTASSAIAAASTASGSAAAAAPWHFTPLVTQCSIALLPSLARKIEAHCAAAADRTAKSPTSSSPASSSSSSPSSSSLPLSSTPALQQLRTNILYLATNMQSKAMWKKEPPSKEALAAAAGGEDPEERIEMLSMEKTFPPPAAATASKGKSNAAAASSSSSASSATSSPVFPYTSIIQKSCGTLPTSPSTFLQEFLDIKLRRRLEPLLTSGRVVKELGENTRMLHLLMNMTPLGDKRLRPRDLLVFQDWFVDTTEQEQSAKDADAMGPPQPTFIIYEISVRDPTVTSVPGYRRGEVLLSARIVRPVPTPGQPTRTRTELTVLSQLEWALEPKEKAVLGKLFGKPLRSTAAVTNGSTSGTEYLPHWFLSKFLGLPTSMSLRIPTSKQALTVLAHSPSNAAPDPSQPSGGGSILLSSLGDQEELLHSDENGDIFEQGGSHVGSLDHSTMSLSALSGGEESMQSMGDDIPSLPTSPAAPGVPAHATDDSITGHLPQAASTSPPSTSSLPNALSPHSGVSSHLSSAPPPVPAVVDPNYIPEFQPLAVLGRGAYSKIVQVRAKDTGTLYAMKVLRKVDVVSVGHESHVLTEQAILARMNHPFVCRLFYAFQSQTKLYMVMSYAPGGDLWTLIRRQKLTEEQCAFYTAELVLAVRYLHSHSVIHRDIKPENILLTGRGHVILADFGLSHERSHADQRSYSVSGTSEYLSPEAIRNTGHGPAMDWWQVGVILHELLTGGKHPFYHKNLFRMQQNILHRPPSLSDTISPEARSLISALLTKDPNTRLGCDVAGKDIESHPFFLSHATAGKWGPVGKGAGERTWERLEGKLVAPTYRPRLNGPGDVSHFDSTYTNEPPLGSVDSNGQPKATPDSVFNSLAHHSNSLSLRTILDESGGADAASMMETNFSVLSEVSELGASNDLAAASPEDLRRSSADVEEEAIDAELRELMASGHSAANQPRDQQQSQYSNPMLAAPFQPRETQSPSLQTNLGASGLSIGVGLSSIHPNAQYGGLVDDGTPFHSHHPASQTMLYNASPMLSPTGGPLSHMSLPQLPGSRSTSAGGSPALHPMAGAPGMYLPPLPGCFADSHAPSTSSQSDSISQHRRPSHSLTSSVDQDYFNSTKSGSSMTGSAGGAPSPAFSPSPSHSVSGHPSTLPHPGLFLRSQSLPLRAPSGGEGGHMHASMGGGEHSAALTSPGSYSGGSVGSGGSSQGSTPSNATQHSAHHPTSMLPPPRLHYPAFGSGAVHPPSHIPASGTSRYSSSGSGSHESGSGNHTPISGGRSIATGAGTGAGGAEYYASSSSSLPNSFHPQHQAQTNHPSTSAHGRASLSGNPMYSPPTGMQYPGGGGGGHHPSNSTSLSRSISSSGSSGERDQAGFVTQQQQQQYPNQGYSQQPQQMGYQVAYPPAGGAGIPIHGVSQQAPVYQRPSSSCDVYDEIEAQYLEPDEAYLPPSAAASAYPNQPQHVYNSNLQAPPHPSSSSSYLPSTPPSNTRSHGLSSRASAASVSAIGQLSIPTSRPASSSTPVSPSKYAQLPQQQQQRYAFPPPQQSNAAQTLFASQPASTGSHARTRSPSSRLQQAYNLLQQQQNHPHPNS